MRALYLIVINLVLLLMFIVARGFKKLPATYKWTVTIRETSDDMYHMVSGWKRIR